MTNNILQERKEYFICYLQPVWCLWCVVWEPTLNLDSIVLVRFLVWQDQLLMILLRKVIFPNHIRMVLTLDPTGIHRLMSLVMHELTLEKSKVIIRWHWVIIFSEHILFLLVTEHFFWWHGHFYFIFFDVCWEWNLVLGMDVREKLDRAHIFIFVTWPKVVDGDLIPFWSTNDSLDLIFDGAVPLPLRSL